MDMYSYLCYEYQMPGDSAHLFCVKSNALWLFEGPVGC